MSLLFYYTRQELANINADRRQRDKITSSIRAGALDSINLRLSKGVKMYFKIEEGDFRGSVCFLKKIQTKTRTTYGYDYITHTLILGWDDRKNVKQITLENFNSFRFEYDENASASVYKKFDRITAKAEYMKNIKDRLGNEITEGSFVVIGNPTDGELVFGNVRSVKVKVEKRIPYPEILVDEIAIEDDRYIYRYTCKNLDRIMVITSELRDQLMLAKLTFTGISR